MIELAVIVSLLIYIFASECLSRAERRKLLEMIMAKNLVELKETEKKELPQKQEIEKMPELMPLDTVSDEQFMSAIKEDLGRTPLDKKVSNAIKKKLGRKIYG